MRHTGWVLLVATVVRLAAVLWLSDTVPYSDYFYYHEAGRLQAENPSFLFQRATVEQYAKLSWWPPGYPLFLAAVYTVAGPQHRAAVYVQLLLGVATCALAMAIARRACGPRAGLLAGWLIALDPTLVFTTTLLASENLFTPLVAAGLWVAGGARTPRRFAVGGLVLGLAALVRAAGLCIPAVVAAWAWRRGRAAGGRAAAVAVVAGAALAIVPWTVRNLVVTGSPAFVCFGGGLNFYYGHNDAPPGYRPLAQTPLAGLGDAAAIDRRGYQLGFETLRRRPLGFVSRGVRKVAALFAPPRDVLHANAAIEPPRDATPSAPGGAAAQLPAQEGGKERLLHGPLLWLAALHTYVLLALMVVALARSWGWLAAEIQLAAWVVATWIALHVVFWAQPRFRTPMDVPMAVVAAAALRPRRATAGRPLARAV